jgi:hypothetical protein
VVDCPHGAEHTTQGTLRHLAAILEANRGIPADGDLREDWDAAERFGFEPIP